MKWCMHPPLASITDVPKSEVATVAPHCHVPEYTRLEGRWGAARTTQADTRDHRRRLRLKKLLAPSPEVFCPDPRPAARPVRYLALLGA